MGGCPCIHIPIVVGLLKRHGLHSGWDVSGYKCPLRCTKSLILGKKSVWFWSQNTSTMTSSRGNPACGRVWTWWWVPRWLLWPRGRRKRNPCPRSRLISLSVICARVIFVIVRGILVRVTFVIIIALATILLSMTSGVAIVGARRCSIKRLIWSGRRNIGLCVEEGRLGTSVLIATGFLKCEHRSRFVK